MSDKQTEILKKRLDNETQTLLNKGWSTEEVDLLKKHFGFYIGLVNGKIKPTKESHKEFIKNIRNRKSTQPTDIHQKVYLKYLDFFNQQNLDNKNKNDKPDEIWKNIDKNPIGMREYPPSVVEKLNTEYEEISYDEWYDDWKHS